VLRYCPEKGQHKMSKASFLFRVLRAYLERQDKTCPYCDNGDTRVTGRKYLILQLRKCAVCNLMFRWPKDTPEFNKSFYQDTYQQVGLTTELPSLESLEKLVASNFRGTEKDFSEQIAVLKELVPEGRALDFGCSWGYASFQLQQAGYDVIGFEISKPRAAFGRNYLRANILDEYDSLDRFRNSFDVIFSSHVLEHLPNFKGVFERFGALLKPEGILLLFVPNCGGENAARLGVRWGPMVCEKHPQALDRNFFETILPKHGFAVKTFSEPYDPKEIGLCVSKSITPHEPRGDELMVYARKMTN